MGVFSPRLSFSHKSSLNIVSYLQGSSSKNQFLFCARINSPPDPTGCDSVRGTGLHLPPHRLYSTIASTAQLFRGTSCQSSKFRLFFPKDFSLLETFVVSQKNTCRGYSIFCPSYQALYFVHSPRQGHRVDTTLRYILDQLPH